MKSSRFDLGGEPPSCKIGPKNVLFPNYSITDGPTRRMVTFSNLRSTKFPTILVSLTATCCIGRNKKNDLKNSATALLYTFYNLDICIITQLISEIVSCIWFRKNFIWNLVVGYFLGNISTKMSNCTLQYKAFASTYYKKWQKSSIRN